MRRWLVTMFAAGAFLLWLGMATAVQDPRVVRYTVPIRGLAQPVRVVQLSDLHASLIDMPPVRLARIVDRANALRPDLVVLTGDYMGAKIWDLPMRLEAALYPLARLRAPLGVFAVGGNHDSPYWLARVLARTPVRLLSGTAVDVGPLVLVGAPDLDMTVDAPDAFAAAAAAVPPGKPAIGLSHEPDFFNYLPARLQLLIAGHTHGGQVAPFGISHLDGFLGSHRRGRFFEHGQWLVVSSGLGTTFVPLRLGVPPEIVEITLVPAGHSVGRNSGTDR